MVQLIARQKPSAILYFKRRSRSIDEYEKLDLLCASARGE